MTLATRTLAVALALAAAALARTDLAGCTYTDLTIKPTQQAAYASRLWYVPGTGEVCAFLDCGGGRAPPKSTVPGCPLYTGTATYAPSYVDLKTLGNGVVEAGQSVVLATTPVPSSSADAATTTTSTPSTAILSGTPRLTVVTSTLTGSSALVSSSTLGGGASSSARATSGSSASSTAAASSGSSSGAAKTTSPSSAAGAMQTAGAVLGPCVVAAAAIAAGLA